jgi:diadenosine tetraphosphate (Ap4A) HIT family hydrolase
VKQSIPAVAAHPSPLASPACELCSQDGGEVLWRDDGCRVVLVADPDYAGYCRVIWNAHVKEMTELAPGERRRCMDVVFAVEHALRELLQPDKVNLASFGNLTPHVHWHVIPRFASDPHFPNSIWGARERPASPPDMAGLAAKLRARLEPELTRRS